MTLPVELAASRRLRPALVVARPMRRLPARRERASLAPMVERRGFAIGFAAGRLGGLAHALGLLVLSGALLASVGVVIHLVRALELW